MTTATYDVAIRARIEAFVREIESVYRAAALEAVRSAIEPGAQSAHANGAVGEAAPLPKRRLPSRAARDAAAIRGPLTDLLRSSGGMRIDEIVVRTRMPAAKLVPLVAHLVKRGQLLADQDLRGTIFRAP
ncbi:MAG: hypothetical protein GC161_08370 [Planctomycetaceae bacterium]|nr:hypothetical protein [Planctomycetaceae bacterium]